MSIAQHVAKIAPKERELVQTALDALQAAADGINLRSLSVDFALGEMPLSGREWDRLEAEADALQDALQLIEDALHLLRGKPPVDEFGDVEERA